MSNRDAAYKVVQKLRREGFGALFEGGGVRDRLLARPPATVRRQGLLLKKEGRVSDAL